MEHKIRSVAPVRSLLFVPGNHPQRVPKALAAGADVVIVDLEDAVPVAEKEATRAIVLAALGAPRRVRAYVRINSVDTHWCMADLEALVGPWLDGIVVPKVESADHLKVISERMTDCERRRGMDPGALDLLPIIETARGIEGIRAIAAGTARVRRLSFGGADYSNDLDLGSSDDEAEFAYARARLAHASRAAGLEPPIDTVVTQIRDQERFRRSARNARLLGFGGKLCIHPDQIAPCHEVFTPSADEITRARRIVAAFEAAESAGSAAIQVDGQFVDYPVLYKARRVLALARTLERD
jgi:citrate lyase subunit beta/citryl-CoA lyase